MKKKIAISFLSLVLAVTMMPLTIYAQTKTNQNNYPSRKSLAHANTTVDVSNENELIQAINEAKSYESQTIRFTENNFSLKKTPVILEDKVTEIDMDGNQITIPKDKEAIDIFDALTLINSAEEEYAIKEYIIKGNNYRVIHVAKAGILSMNAGNNGKFAIRKDALEDGGNGADVLNNVLPVKLAMLFAPWEIPISH